MLQHNDLDFIHSHHFSWLIPVHTISIIHFCDDDDKGDNDDDDDDYDDGICMSKS